MWYEIKSTTDHWVGQHIDTPQVMLYNRYTDITQKNKSTAGLGAKNKNPIG